MVINQADVLMLHAFGYSILLFKSFSSVFSLQVAAVNKAGIGPFSQSLYYKTAEARKQHLYILHKLFAKP